MQPADMAGYDPKRPRQEMLTSPQLNNADQVTTGYLQLRNMSVVGLTRGMSSLRQVKTPTAMERSVYTQGTTRAGDAGAQQALGRFGPWAERYHAIVRQRYINVPLWASSGVPLRQYEGRNRNAYRKAQPNVRVIALSQALQNSMAAIARQRGQQP
jgi:hypothetical protein